LYKLKFRITQYSIVYEKKKKNLHRKISYNCRERDRIRKSPNWKTLLRELEKKKERKKEKKQQTPKDDKSH
jgi:hypothetical protein